MAALVSEIKARQASKAAKQRTSAPAVGGIPSAETGIDASTSDGGATRAGPVGGIMLGERGKEMIREKQGQHEGSEASTSSKGTGSWFSGRI